MFDFKCLEKVKKGVKIVNVGRGPLINEDALLEGLKSNIIASAALDVFEDEPFDLIKHSRLLNFSDRLILGSHNGSNTFEAVYNVSRTCITKLAHFLSKYPI